MIRFEEEKEGFKLYFKDYLFLKHTAKNPCISLGKGTAKYKTRFGGFKIKKKLQKRIQLRDFKTISKEKDNIALELRAQDIKLKLKFTVADNRLEIVPECDDPTINRFWIALQANPNEAIYGCGEQFSELNLRGKNVPLWVEEQGMCRGDPKWITAIMNLVYLGGHWYSKCCCASAVG